VGDNNNHGFSSYYYGGTGCRSSKRTKILGIGWAEYLAFVGNASSFKWRDTKEGPRSLGFGHHDPALNVANGWGYRFGRWKYVEGSVSCNISDCRKPQLFNLAKDIGERHDISEEYPDILADIKLKFRDWHESVMKSRLEESKCRNSNQLMMPQSFARLI